MAVNRLNTTTLAEALSVGQNEYNLASTSNVAVGSLLIIAGRSGVRVDRVQEIPVSGRVKVMPGVNGSQSRAQVNAALVYIATPDLIKNVRDNAVALLGDAGELPDYCLPGVRAKDGAGNEYVLVELTQTVVSGATVLISKDGNFTAGVLTSTGVGNVGVMAEPATSDQFAWAQIAGSCRAKLVGGSSLVSSLGDVIGASSVSTPSVGLLGRSSSQRSSAFGEAQTIYGMFPASAATTASTSASSETGLACTVWLSYPYAQRAITS